MRIAVVGHALVDYEFVVEKIPLPDDETRVLETHIFPGGSALNTSIGIKNLNEKVVLIANIGTDKRGKFLLDFIEKSSLGKQGLRLIRGKTGYCFVLRDLKGNVTLISKLNVAEPIVLDDAINEIMSTSSHIHLTSLTPEGIKKVIDYIKNIQSNVSISWDIGRVSAGNFQSFMIEALKKTDIAFISEREAKKLNELADPEVTAEKLSQKGKNLVVLKRIRGALAFNEGRKVSEVRVEKEFAPVDTLGAGDAFAASFLVHYLKGTDIIETLGKAVVFASLKVGKKGGSNMPSIFEFETTWKDVQDAIKFFKRF